MEFDPVASRKHAKGWTAEKQGYFLRHLAATGCVKDAAELVGMSVRSAFYLRNRTGADSFRDGWDRALMMAAGNLLAVAYQRALHGSTRQLWRDGKLVGEITGPSDRVLLWLLGHGAPRGVPSSPVYGTHPEKMVENIRGLRDVPPDALDLEEMIAEASQDREAAALLPALPGD